MGAGAPYGNKNAEKWTFENSLEIFEKAIELANETETIYHDKEPSLIIGKKYKFDFIGEVARELGYYKSLFTELKDKFEDLKHLHTQLVETLEANCFCNSKNGIIKEATAIVNLKSNHNWTDRQQFDHNLSTEKKVELKINGIDTDLSI